MPEYLAPGVYIEETSFRTKTIEGVSTSTAGFVGPARYGPTEGEPELLTSFADFQRIYGGLDPMSFNGTAQTNFLAQAVRAFFEEGGRRLYVSRVYTEGSAGAGRAGADNQDDSPPETLINLEARFPGVAGNMRITFLPRLSDNLLAQDRITGRPRVQRIRDNDTVLVTTDGSPPVTELHDVVRQGDDLALETTSGTPVQIGDLDPNLQQVRLLTVDVAVERPIVRPKRPDLRYEEPEVLEGFGFHPEHANALTNYFQETPPTRIWQLMVPFAINPSTTGLDTGYEMAQALLGADVIAALTDENATLEERQRQYRLTGGSDGALPSAQAYLGDSTAESKSGLAAFEDLENISIVAAPGYSDGYVGAEARAETIQAHLINHCHKMRYRIGVLDSADRQAISSVMEYRGKVDSTHAALYYPWVTILDPVTEEEINLPPSGFVAGIYARNDVEHGVHKAPANEVVRLAIGFEFLLNKAQQDVLNPEGVNCFRFFEGRGYRLWGARTISSDPEWKYVNLRRYFAYLERSIERGTQWVVFENNSEPLWANVRRTVEDFLFNEWKSGHLMGERPQEAYFVRCDRSTMTQNDLDNGRLICLVGVAPVRPAEFVIFRIGQWTADSRS